MVTRVATAFQNENTLRNLQLANQGMALTTYQITTGLKSQKISDDPANMNTIISLRDVATKTSSYLANLSTAKNTLTSAESALNQLTDLLSDAVSLATTARNESSADTRATLAPKAQALAESFYTLFNSQYNGQYLFSGSNAAQSPISSAASAQPFPGSPVPTTWYEGDDQLASVISGAGTTLQYGVLGDDPTFANLKAGLESLWYGLQNNNLTEIDSATSALTSAKTGLSSLLGNVGGQLNTIDLLSTRQTSQQSIITNQLNDLDQVDVSTALTQFSQQQATLQASMLIITKVNSLSLLDYLH
jgi:flagellar hook-associated protein 3 FlgL